MSEKLGNSLFSGPFSIFRLFLKPRDEVCRDIIMGEGLLDLKEEAEASEVRFDILTSLYNYLIRKSYDKKIRTQEKIRNLKANSKNLLS